VSVPVNGIPLPGETLYVPAVIHSTRVLGLETSYCVFFHPLESELRAVLPNRKEYRAEQIIGPGFQTVSSVRRFAAGQRVFLTFKGREMAGTVSRHDVHADELLLALDDKQKDCNSLLETQPLTVRRRVDEIRLLESRKSARLLDSDTDHRVLVDGQPASYSHSEVQQQPNSRPRTVSLSQLQHSSSDQSHSADTNLQQQKLPHASHIVTHPFACYRLVCAEDESDDPVIHQKIS